MIKTRFGMPMILIAIGAATSSLAEEQTIEGACLARDLADGSTCACVQQVADNGLRPALHGLVAEFLGKRVSTAQIASSRGRSGAESFEWENKAFKRDVRKECGLRLR